ncbi:TPA: hypothetical protein DIC40_08270 [Patescibacteria group bacterium]|nr:Orotate phosphoribosyltransferase [candidate division SR1 bacterium RAAC1_SR1_1]HCY21778.1 hypothetical protein [Candidatus Gracilibacteria bacterium]
MRYFPKLKKEQLKLLVSCNGFEFTEQKNKPWFDYTSNQIGPYYVQSMAVFSNASASQSAINAMIEYINNQEMDIDIISAGESRDWPFAFPIQNHLGKDIKMLYKDGKTSFGTFDLKDKKILHIGDLNNEGSSIRKWQKMIQEAGGTIKQALFYVDRMENGVKVLEELGIERHAIVDLDNDSWQYLMNNGFISQSMYQELIKYWEDPLKWGCEKIIKHPEPIFELIKNEKKRERGIGIFELYNKETNGKLASILGVRDFAELLLKVSINKK